MSGLRPADARRRTTWIAAAVAVAVVAVGAVVFLTLRPAQTLTPAPAPAPITAGPTAASPASPAAPTPSMTPTRTPSRAPSATARPAGGSTAPATSGQLPAGFTLLHEGAPAVGDNAAWELAPWAYGCPGRIPVFASFGSLVATRGIEATGIEWAGSETILVFTTDASADRFLGELKAASAACSQPGADAASRTRTAQDDFAGPWDAGLALRAWDEHSPDGGATWVPRPGASLDLVVRKGRGVVISTQGGEFLGDPLQSAEAMAETRKAVDAAVGPMCAFTAGGC